MQTPTVSAFRIYHTETLILYVFALIKIYRPPRIVFIFHENLLDEKLPEIKRTFSFF